MPIGCGSGAIPGADIGSNGLEYYVEADVGGNVVQVDGRPDMPHVASAPYGDPAAASYCGTAATPPAGDGEVQPAPAEDIPTTGGGLAFVALGVLLLAGLARRRDPFG